MSYFGNLESDLKSLANEDKDIEMGLFALSEYYHAAVSQSGSQVPQDFNEFLEKMKEGLFPIDAAHAWPSYKLSYYSKHPDESFKNIFVKGLGGMINVAGFSLMSDQVPLSHDKVTDAMTNLAQKAQGRIPSSLNEFTGFIIDQGTEVNFIDAVWYTAVKSTEQIAEAAEEAGKEIIDTAGSLLNTKII